MKATTQAQFNPVYRAAQKHEVQALDSLSETIAREIRARELAFKGFIIDWEIAGLGLDPFGEMLRRIDAKYVDPATGRGWYPSAMQSPLQQAPNFGAPTPGLPIYDPSKPPDGSLLVSLELDDFPPVDPIIVTPNPPGLTSLVGGPMGYTWPGNNRPAYFAFGTPGPDGFRYPDPIGRGEFTFHRIQNLPPAFTIFFTLNYDALSSAGQHTAFYSTATAGSQETRFNPRGHTG
jgi:hypothetical protein